MYKTQCVLGLLALYVVSANCFSWDIVLGGEHGLIFHNNGTLAHYEDIPLARIFSITYDPVHNRVLFHAEIYNIFVISSFNIATKKLQNLVRLRSKDIDMKFAYDPATETLFCTGDKIYSYSLKPGSKNTADENRFVDLDEWAKGIAVDSCGGYIYWTTKSNIERARLDGSEREVLINSTVWLRQDLAIDQQTQKMYWTEKHLNGSFVQLFIESADLNGENRKTLYSVGTLSNGGHITVSKDFVYWRTWGDEDTYYRLEKSPRRDRAEPKQFTIDDTGACDICDSLAANYRVEDQTQGSQPCEALTSLLPSVSSKAPTDASLLCVHGTKVIGESVCNCTQGYTGGRCDVPICQNYCLYGDCSVSDQQPKCSCNAGYSGERCEVNVCQQYCLNDGVCSLNEESEPVCHCAGDYEGERCDVPVFLTKCFQTVSMLRDILNADVTLPTLGKGMKSTCASAGV